LAQQRLKTPIHFSSTLRAGADNKSGKGDAMNIFIFKDGQRQGPFSLEETRRMRAEGRLQNADYAWYEGIADWIPLASVPGIALPSPGMPPVPPAPAFPAAAMAAPSADNSLLVVKRLFTAFVLFCVLFVFLFVVIFMVSLMVGGGIAGAQAAAQHPDTAQNFQSGYNLGEQAGRDFGMKYTKPIALASVAGAFVVGGIVSLWVSFSNLLPWCRRR
jgi:hypothetical protein